MRHGLPVFTSFCACISTVQDRLGLADAAALLLGKGPGCREACKADFMLEHIVALSDGRSLEGQPVLWTGQSCSADRLVDCRVLGLQSQLA